MINVSNLGDYIITKFGELNGTFSKIKLMQLAFLCKVYTANFNEDSDFTCHFYLNGDNPKFLIETKLYERYLGGAWLAIPTSTKFYEVPVIDDYTEYSVFDPIIDNFKETYHDRTRRWTMLDNLLKVQKLILDNKLYYEVRYNHRLLTNKTYTDEDVITLCNRALTGVV